MHGIPEAKWGVLAKALPSCSNNNDNNYVNQRANALVDMGRGGVERINGGIMTNYDGGDDNNNRKQTYGCRQWEKGRSRTKGPRGQCG